MKNGEIIVTVSDNQGEKLPGVVVELTGAIAPRTGVTNAEGKAHFNDLPAGTYSIKTTMTGFGTVERKNIHVGNDTVQIPIVMTPESTH